MGEDGNFQLVIISCWCKFVFHYHQLPHGAQTSASTRSSNLSFHTELKLPHGAQTMIWIFQHLHFTLYTQPWASEGEQKSPWPLPIFWKLTFSY